MDMLSFQNSSVPFWTAVAAMAAAFAGFLSLCAVAVSLRYLHIMKKTYLAQAGPKVILYVKHDYDRPTLLMLIAENVGRDIAYNVKFSPSRPLPKTAWGIAEQTAESIQPIEEMTEGPIISGIPAFGPGDYRRINWGQIGGLRTAIGSSPIEVKIEYTFEGKRITSFASLEVSSFANVDASESPMSIIAGGVNRIANRLETIRFP